MIQEYGQEEMLGERKRVKITLTSRQITTNPGGMGQAMSLFDLPRYPGEEEPYAEDAPEDYPDEMRDAICEMIDREGAVLSEYFDRSAYAPAGEEPFFAEEEEDQQSVTRRVEEFVDWLFEQQGIRPMDEDDDTVIFRSLGTMEKRRTPRGEAIAISYTEGDGMDHTETVILYEKRRKNCVSIYRTGDVISTLVCQEGRRHYSVYETPVMPFEVAVYTKKCQGGFTWEMGGTMELDYAIELRGTDLQRTIMTVDVQVLD